MKKLVRILCTIVYSICYMIFMPIVLGFAFIMAIVFWVQSDKSTFKEELKSEFKTWIEAFPKPTKLFEKNEDEFRW